MGKSPLTQLYLFLNFGIKSLRYGQASVEEIALIVLGLVRIPLAGILFHKLVGSSQFADVVVLAGVLHPLQREGIDAFATLVQIPWKIILPREQTSSA